MLQKNNQKFQFQFIDGIQELISPFIRVTKSVNGETGTVTFIFFSPTFLEKTNFCFSSSSLESLSLISDKEILKTKDINVFFKDGKPFLVKATLILQNSFDWYNFFYFMSNYSKESGLSFDGFEKINPFSQ